MILSYGNMGYREFKGGPKKLERFCTQHNHISRKNSYLKNGWAWLWCLWQNLICLMDMIALKIKIITSKSILILNCWIVLQVSLNILSRFFNNKKLYFLKLGLTFIGSVLIHFLKYNFFLEMWSLLGKSLSNFVPLFWIWHNP